jgi:hypothetical protein
MESAVGVARISVTPTNARDVASVVSALLALRSAAKKPRNTR